MNWVMIFSSPLYVFPVSWISALFFTVALFWRLMGDIFRVTLSYVIGFSLIKLVSFKQKESHEVPCRDAWWQPKWGSQKDLRDGHNTMYLYNLTGAQRCHLLMALDMEKLSWCSTRSSLILTSFKVLESLWRWASGKI